VHLKSLTLRGFKSFASSTTLRFEPGITCVVGPNGSGKSNVVDALAWVMGEQGAKSLRGGKMDDVIFAGTSGRPPLGRAEVLLTIDNSDGALPIDYTEVTLSRILFRNGSSEYAINGSPSRLLDVQELLSDSGIGREMHVVVGQGQLDAVLAAGPEERRGFIEEAAGVLKHRKRKEKALRKLEAMQANLARLQDLTAELRRQLKPLGRQAEVARRAAVVQADVRDARLRLLADDLEQLRAAFEREVSDEEALLARRSGVEEAVAAARARETELTGALHAEGPQLARAQETWYHLSAVRERFRGTASLAAERVRQLAVPADDMVGGRPPDELEREAAAARAQERNLHAELEASRTRLAEAVEVRTLAETALDEEERRLAASRRAAADRRDELARLASQVAAQRSRVAAGEAELERLTAAREEARARSGRCAGDVAALEQQVAGLDAGEVGLDAAHEQASTVLEDVETRLRALRVQEREAERERAALLARREALELGLLRKDGVGALLADVESVSGVLGSVAAVLSVEPGYESAVAAALGAAADAVAVSSIDAAVEALHWLKRHDAGRAGFVVGGGVGNDGNGFRPASWPELPGSARYAVDLISTDSALRPSLHRLLQRVAVVDDLATGYELVRRDSDVRAVTRDGDVLGPAWSSGGSSGSSGAPSLLEVQAAADEAAERLELATRRVREVQRALDDVDLERRQASARVEETLGRLHESDAELAAVVERLGQLTAQGRAASAEAERLTRTILTAEAAQAANAAELARLTERLAATEAAETSDLDGEPDPIERDRLAQECGRVRQAETDARLAVRTVEERVRALGGRAEALGRAAASERAARERAVTRQARRERERRVAAAVVDAAQQVLARLEFSLHAAARQRAAVELRRSEFEEALAATRGELRDLDDELDRLTDSVHRDEVARAEQRLRIEQLELRAIEEHGVEPESLLTDYGTHVAVPVPTDSTVDEAPASIPYVREEQEKRLRAAERALALLGRVNPLALEEYAALEERLRFLSEQLEDLKASRRDLLTVVREVDQRVEEAFSAAYQDTAREFAEVFARLFPGGEGRLVLTEPDDMLASGVEVEARPAGKKIKRLSLLSGGERSLTAIALLVAIFKARPSPFYVLDEVEAALDDTNLQRLLDILAELRETSQLIVITHQKRTMEIADALYGVSMRGDGVTSVISQRLREAASA
jgi:chromosome segregation protein